MPLSVVKQHTPPALLDQHPPDFQPDPNTDGSSGFSGGMDDHTPCWALVQELMKVRLLHPGPKPLAHSPGPWLT